MSESLRNWDRVAQAGFRAGHVIDDRGEYVHVAWDDGTRSFVQRSTLTVVGKGKA